ncbi:DUF2493 domain-containing protein [Nevskia ramosa]|uniref:DUF2493 domain-containing protein n=1 Tax=Nevskia ramosa TaxID=64002 RepID=UPI003D1423D3
MKVAVIGSRSFADRVLLTQTLDQMEISVLISGGAKGADQLAQSYAESKRIQVEIYKPDWRIGRGAGPVRNAKIIEACDQVVAFWDGESAGTKDAVAKARAKGRPVKVITFQKPQT